MLGSLSPSEATLELFLRGGRAGQAFVMVSLLRFKDERAAARYLAEYGTPAREIILEVGGRPIWAGRSEHVLVDTGRTGWDLTVLVWYPNRRTYRAFLDHPKHRAIQRVRDECVEATIQLATEEMIRDL
jgi:uncharacterized protein (DUF1330 family)